MIRLLSILIRVRNGQAAVLLVSLCFKIVTSLKCLVGHTIADICIIFRIVPSHRHSDETMQHVYNRFLAYVRRYDIVNQPNPENTSLRGVYPEPNTGLYLLRKSARANGQRLGDIVPVNQIRALVDLTPRFGSKANRRLTSSSSIAYSTEFWLNKYFNKELFYALS
jgi:hypothetical protein